jgi:predicted DNA-binding transcriptional regulator AlpA
MTVNEISEITGISRATLYREARKNQDWWKAVLRAFI